VKLRDCDCLTNISALGFVPTLHIYRAELITSVKGLRSLAGNRNVYIKSIRASDLSPLHDMDKLVLSCYDFLSLRVKSLENIRDLSILHGYMIETVLVTNIYRLELHYCRKLKSLNGLSKIRKLYLSEYDQLENIENLGNIPELKVIKIVKCSIICARWDNYERHRKFLMEKIPNVSIE
jgi:hypothetical protein